MYDESNTDEGRVDLKGEGLATVQSAGSGTVTADASMDGTRGGIGAILAMCTDPSTTYTIELLRDVSAMISVQAALDIDGNGHKLTLAGDSSLKGLVISGDVTIDGDGFSLTTSSERGILISQASAGTTIAIEDLILVNGYTERNSDGVAVSYGITDWMAGSPGGSRAVDNGYGLKLDDVTVRGYDSKGVYVGAASALDIGGCTFDGTAKTWYIPSKYRTGGTVDSTDDIRNGGWDVTGGDFALQIRNFAVGAEITIRDCTFTGENGRLSSIMVTQYTAQISKLSVSGCAFDRSHSTSLGDVSIGKALSKDGSNAANIANQAIARADLVAGKGGMTVVYRGDDRIDDPDTTDAKELLAGMESNALAGFDATPLRLYLEEGASLASDGVWTGSSSSTVSISVSGGVGAEGALRSGETLGGEFTMSSLLLKEGASVDATASSGTGGSVGFSASSGNGGVTLSYGSDGFAWSGACTGMDSLRITGAVVLAVGSVTADIELTAPGSSVFFQKDAVYNGTVSYGGSSAAFKGVSMGSDTSVSAGSVGLSGDFSSVSEGSISISGEGTMSGIVQDIAVTIGPGASVAVPADRSLVLGSATVDVSEGATLTVHGSLMTVDGSAITNDGTIAVDGTYRAATTNNGKVSASVGADISKSLISGTGTLEQEKPAVSVGGASFEAAVGGTTTIPVTVTKGAELLLIVTGSDGKAVDAGWVSYSDGAISAAPTAAGTFTVTATPHIGENVGQPVSFTIVATEPAPEPQSEDDDDGSLALYAGAAVLVVAILAIAAYAYLRHR